MNRINWILITCLGLLTQLATAGSLFAQDGSGNRGLPDSSRKKQIALFLPLYLDSAFDGQMNYLHRESFPKYFNPGLEFYEGISFALDSLEAEGIALDVHVFDTRSAASSVPALIRGGKLDQMDLLIGQVNVNEAKLLATTAARLQIPFVNATLPNAAGTTNNPQYIILNSTLQAHFVAIYRYLQKNFPLAPLVVFRRRGAQEDLVRNFLDQISAQTASIPLKIKYVTLDPVFTAKDLEPHLDADRQTVCIAGSLDVAFGEALTRELANLKSGYPSIVMGMPTWWEATDFSRPEFRDMEVIFTTTFYLSPADSLAMRITRAFKTKFYSRPTEMFYRGYETMYRFAHLLLSHGRNLSYGLSDRRHQLFTAYDLQPVMDARTTTIKYFENKKIYFVRKLNGEVTQVE